MGHWRIAIGTDDPHLTIHALLVLEILYSNHTVIKKTEYQYGTERVVNRLDANGIDLAHPTYNVKGQLYPMRTM